MTKKIIAVVCLLAVLVGVFTMAATQASATENAYKVGYSRVDINPYIEPDLTGEDKFAASNIMWLPLRGSGDVWNRPSSKGMVDDNGDGVIDENDGLKATCIAISDNNNKTVLMITIDLIGGTMVDKVREEVVARVNAEYGEGFISETDIFYAGTHNHEAPDTTVAGKKADSTDYPTGYEGVEGAHTYGEMNDWLDEWIARTIEDIGDAAVAAMKDRAAATLTKDQISASESSAVDGRVMNATRHYETKDAAGTSLVAGDNFNSNIFGDKRTSSTDATAYTYASSRGDDPKQVTAVDDTMYLLKFAFADTSKLPIILSDWRGHPSLNNTDRTNTDGTVCTSKNAISGDYVSAYRHALEYGCTVDDTNDSADSSSSYYGWGVVQSWEFGTKQVYRAAFFQGTGGNVNPRGYEMVKNKYTTATKFAAYWIDVSAYQKNDAGHYNGRGNSYGVVLATMAAEGISDGENEVAVTYADIETQTTSYKLSGKTEGLTQLAYDAAVAYQTAVAAGETITHPWKYTSTSGEVFWIASRFHASSIKGDWYSSTGVPRGATSTPAMELSTILLGENLAFVVVPGEAFDYYYADNSTNNTDASNNLWNDLVSDTYGKPFVLGYCNGAVGYIPNYYAYTNNEDISDKYAVGSYEGGQSNYEQGTGELMVRLLKQMLDGLTSDSYKGSCDHCGDNVTWQPLRPYTYATTDEDASGKLITGHYYLASDISVTIDQLKVSGGQTVCIDLCGHTMTGECRRAFYTEDTTKDIVNIMDSGDGGSIKGSGAPSGTSGGFGGGVALVAKNDEMNLYTGTLQGIDKEGSSVQRGGVLRLLGTLNMYGGKITGGVAASSEEGTIYDGSDAVVRTGSGSNISVGSAGVLNLYGGEISGGKLYSIKGAVGYSTGYTETRTLLQNDGIYVESGGAVKLAGSAAAEHLQYAVLNAKKLTVAGNYTGSVELEYDDKTVFSDLDVVGAAVADDEGNAADASYAAITLTDAQGKYAAVKGSDLVVSDEPYTWGTCEACGEVQWRPMTDADFDACGKTGLGTGHYVLTGDVETEQKQLQTAGTYCLDLAGHTFTGATRAFLVYAGATLNIMDSKGNGILEGPETYGGAGGALYVYANGTINLYSGNVYGSNNTTRGGTVFVLGDFNVYGGKVYGGSANSTSGDNVGGTVCVRETGRFTASGGDVYSGTATVAGDCVYIYSGGNVVLAGTANVADIYFAASSASALTVKGAYTGTVELQYADTVELADGTDVGNCQADTASNAADISNANIAFAGHDELNAEISGTDLVVNTSYITGTCKACGGDEVQWIPMTDADFDDLGTSNMAPGHYVLTGDVETEQKQLKTDGTYCLDLAGHTFTGATRAFLVYAGATLNIMDSKSGGIVEGKSGAATGGGVLYVYEDAAINLYGGTVQHNTANSKVTLAGGAVRAYGGAFNLIGGTVKGGNVTTYGGAVYVTARTTEGETYYGSFTASGGTVTAGTATTAGPCVYVADGCNATLSGTADVADIYFGGSYESALMIDTANGAYTGSVQLSYQGDPIVGKTVGTCTAGTDLSGATVALAGSDLQVVVDGTALKVVNLNSGADIYNDTTLSGTHTTLVDAITNYTYSAEERNFIKLNEDVTEQEEITVSGKDVYLDLNGYDIPAITVDEGWTLYVMDSKTDNYAVADMDGGLTGYGKIGTVNGAGTVAAVALGTISATGEEDGVRAGYLMLAADDGSVSFHRFYQNVTYYNLRTSGDGMYFTSIFFGDELVKAAITDNGQFGVALSITDLADDEAWITGIEDTKTTGRTVLYSEYTGDDFDSGVEVNSTVLKNIMSTDNGSITNARNANTRVYGRPYILIDGQYYFGDVVDDPDGRGEEGDGYDFNTLSGLVKCTNSKWDDLTWKQKDAVMEMYERYPVVMNDWDVENIKQTVKEEAKTLKVLTLGHSLAVDSGHMLALIANAEGYENLRVGTLYKSGCKLTEHVSYLTNDSASYSLYLSSTDTYDTPPLPSANNDIQGYKGVTMKFALEYDYWDVIIMQGGVFEIGTQTNLTNGNIQTIQDYVNKYKANPDATFGWHMFWAAPTDNDLRDKYPYVNNTYYTSYEAFNDDRATLYSAITSNVQTVIETDSTFDFVIPSGTTIQNAWANGLMTEKELHRDYVHLTDVGRVMSSYTWLCRLMGIEKLDEIKLDTIPVNFFASGSKTEYPDGYTLSDEEKAIILECVNNALANPYQVTETKLNTTTTE